ncbi:LamG-like jellyroll fold domain-containing protein [Flavobacterium eburneipallidum]|uniref:LamG-like jellyroll fold domain-containing protein n=1 Tax=Flavobacterium eburneipallidum TaxID=3003263 RepID=UPI0022AC709A|nr:LamG-like jellyroll fold domain-containing protein [Flavobacterium eburneipallidum]
MKKSISLILIVVISTISYAQVKTVHWRIDNLTQIGGNAVTVSGNPKVIQTDLGNAIEFDGIKDGLLVNNNPMNEATEFTIEIILKPYSGGAVEQRYLHFQQDENNRILAELRNNNNLNWSLDTFIKSGASNQTLLDYSLVHSLNNWVHVALTYKNGVMTNYVNGVQELIGSVAYQVVNSGQTSIGVRMNQVAWFKGAIHSVKITHAALNPANFIKTTDYLAIQNFKKQQLSTQISPNPVTASAILKYQLDESSNISIKLFTSEGKEIATFFDGYKNAGTHELEINRANLDANIYFVVISSGKLKSTQKLIIK